MKTLHLLRHAKSSWDDPILADHDRPLAPRGERAARRMASHIKRHRIRVDLVLCSSAVRAHQTMDLVAPPLGKKVDISIEDDLYTGDAARVMRRLQRIDDEVKVALVVGHNPALQDLAVDLAGHGEVEALKAIHQKFPTGELATLTTGTRWGKLDRGIGYLESLVDPESYPTKGLRVEAQPRPTPLRLTDSVSPQWSRSKVNEHPSKVLAVLLHSVVERLDLLLL